MGKKKKKIRLKLTLKQRRLIKELGTAKTMREAATKAGYDKETRHIYHKDTKRHLAETMEEMGLTDKCLLKPILEAMEANKTIGYLHQYKSNKNGKVEKCLPDEAVSNEFIEVPDHPTRLKAAELGLKAKGKLKDVMVDIPEGASIILIRAGNNGKGN